MYTKREHKTARFSLSSLELQNKKKTTLLFFQQLQLRHGGIAYNTVERIHRNTSFFFRAT